MRIHNAEKIAKSRNEGNWLHPSTLGQNIQWDLGHNAASADGLNLCIHVSAYVAGWVC